MKPDQRGRERKKKDVTKEERREEKEERDRERKKKSRKRNNVKFCFLITTVLHQILLNVSVYDGNILRKMTFLPYCLAV
jgi:hypothetical protein